MFASLFKRLGSSPNMFPPHPGIQPNQLYGILEYIGTDNGVQLFKAIGETRNDGDLRDSEVYKKDTTYGLEFSNENFPYKDVSQLTPDDLEQYRQSSQATHTLTPLGPSPGNRTLHVKIVAVTPSSPINGLRIRVVAISTLSGGKPKPKTKPNTKTKTKKRYYSKRRHRTFRSRRKSSRSRF